MPLANYLIPCAAPSLAIQTVTLRNSPGSSTAQPELTAPQLPASLTSYPVTSMGLVSPGIYVHPLPGM